MINLLPPWVQNKKDRRSLLMLLATVQVAIFFVLGLLASTITRQEQRAWERSHELTMYLAAFDSSPAEVAAMLNAARSGAAYLDAFIDGATQTVFNRLWLLEILNTIPYGAQLTSLDYRDGQLLLMGEVSELTVIELHRANMYEIFPDVRLGRITHAGDSLYSYELRARVGDMP